MKRKSLGSILQHRFWPLRSACSLWLMWFHVMRNQYPLCGVYTRLVSMPLIPVSCQSRD